MKKARYPRYYCISRDSINCLHRFGAPNDYVDFFEWLYKSSKKLEAGEEIDFPNEEETSPALFSAIEATSPEISDGYEKYMKRASGNRGEEKSSKDNAQAENDQWSSNGQSMDVQWTPIDRIGTEQIRTDQNRHDEDWRGCKGEDIFSRLREKYDLDVKECVSLMSKYGVPEFNKACAALDRAKNVGDAMAYLIGILKKGKGKGW